MLTPRLTKKLIQKNPRNNCPNSFSVLAYGEIKLTQPRFGEVFYFYMLIKFTILVT